MKPVFLLVNKSKDSSYNGNLNVARNFYEMPVYKEEYTREELDEFLKNELGPEVSIKFIGNSGVHFKYKDEKVYFGFLKTLKIGTEYFQLNQIKPNLREKL